MEAVRTREFSGAGDGVCVLGDAPTVRGFRLAGLAGTIVDDDIGAREAFARLCEADASLVVVTEAVAAALGDAAAPEAPGMRPLVVVVPSVREPTRREATRGLARQVQRALGLALEPRA